MALHPILLNRKNINKFTLLSIYSIISLNVFAKDIIIRLKIYKMQEDQINNYFPMLQAIKV